MNDKLLADIIELIESQMGEYRYQITRETSLEKDLGMSGDDATEFIFGFSKKFNVDISRFEIKTYFFPEGDSILPTIIRLFTGRKDPKQKELRVGDLERAAILGRLDEEVLGR